MVASTIQKCNSSTKPSKAGDSDQSHTPQISLPRASLASEENPTVPSGPVVSHSVCHYKQYGGVLQVSRQKNIASPAPHHTTPITRADLQLHIEIQLPAVDLQYLLTGCKAGQWHLHDLPKPSRPDRYVNDVLIGHESGFGRTHRSSALSIRSGRLVAPITTFSDHKRAGIGCGQGERTK